MPENINSGRLQVHCEEVWNFALPEYESSHILGYKCDIEMFIDMLNFPIDTMNVDESIGSLRLFLKQALTSLVRYPHTCQVQTQQTLKWNNVLFISGLPKSQFVSARNETQEKINVLHNLQFIQIACEETSCSQKVSR